MPKQTIVQALKQGRKLLSDGAWGSLLFAKGLPNSECPELWNITHFEDVKDVALGYVAAGSDMIMTNSLGANRFMLSIFALEDKVAEINIAAAKASREAAGEDIWLIASVGPTGKMLIMGEVTEQEIYDAYVEQMTALERGGADAVCVETMSDLDEALIAIRAAKENTSLEVIVTFTFDKTVKGEYRTMMGITPKESATACINAGADVVGTNCSNGIEHMIDITREIRQALPDSYILVQANAGMPVSENGSVVYKETPEYMSQFILPLVEAGADIVGGCCGTTPEHIRLMRKEIDKITK